MFRRSKEELLLILSLLLSLIGCQNGRHDVVGVIPKAAETRHGAPVSDSASVRQQVQLKLIPVDEASQDPSFKKFRDRLLAAAKNHDKAFILSILDKHILNSLGGSGGIKEFEERWNLDQGGDELWDTLITVLSNGGSFSNYQGKKQFCAPYVTSKWRDIDEQLPKDSDPSDFQAIIHDNVDLRSTPNSDSPRITTLSYDIVRVISNSRTTDNPAKDSNWVKVSTLTGTAGYVDSKNIRSPSDYYAYFTKVGPSWVMTALAAGD
jgi:hypothetical protein